VPDERELATVEVEGEESEDEPQAARSSPSRAASAARYRIREFAVQGG